MSKEIKEGKESKQNKPKMDAKDPELAPVNKSKEFSAKENAKKVSMKKGTGGNTLAVDIYSSEVDGYEADGWSKA